MAGPGAERFGAPRLGRLRCGRAWSSPVGLGSARLAGAVSGLVCRGLVGFGGIRLGWHRRGVAWWGRSGSVRARSAVASLGLAGPVFGVARSRRVRCGWVGTGGAGSGLVGRAVAGWGAGRCGAV